MSAHFSVYEFACSDKSDTVLVDSQLIEVLEQIRAHFGAPVHINSGYRTPAYNISIGGSPNSQHCKGTAADIWISATRSQTVKSLRTSNGFPLFGELVV